MVFRARLSVNFLDFPSLAASSKRLAIRWASFFSEVPVLRVVRRPSESVKHAIQNGDLGCLFMLAMATELPQ
jgi:hypothetical protein